MTPPFLRALFARNKRNWAILRANPTAEISGALGDLGTLLPLMLPLALRGSIDLPSTLVWSGVFNVVTGVGFGVPMPVQPMKAIAATALSSPPHTFPPSQTSAAGAYVALAVLLLSTTGLLRTLTTYIPSPVIRGIQLGAGLRLVSSGGRLGGFGWMVLGLMENRGFVVLAMAVLFVRQQRRGRRGRVVVPFALGLVAVWLNEKSWNRGGFFRLWHPRLSIPAFDSMDALFAALAQLPLTTLNSVIAVSALSADLLPDVPPPSVTALGLSVAAMNLVGCWFGAMPVCHGAGGLAGQHRFGARGGASVVMLGVVKVVLGLLFGGDRLVRFLQEYPKSVLGVMVIAAGLELAKAGAAFDEPVDSSSSSARAEPIAVTTGLWERSVSGVAGTRKYESRGKREENWMVMMVTVGGTLAFKSDAVGFLAGWGCCACYRLADRMESRRRPPVGERRPLSHGIGERRPLLHGAV
ncbi:uncharacterized protein C8A04DRAFT_11683 [Dichotomopilus funicola]|uniref:Sulfate transporter n=1 Tax=Dichotomopilus funicola TaxID=1934379 RepID=A0AAN6V3R9_9PEZI|nr:hypothetical protein C8A04DRAFT_11683 [Dichotomopilus funicola]